MLGIDKSAQRVIVVIALLILGAWALRGYFPGGEPAAEQERPPSNPAALIVVIAMLSAAVAVIGYAILARMRDRKPRKPAGGAPFRRGDDRARPTWRLAVIALAVIIGWLVLIVLLSSLGPHGPAQQPAAPPSVADNEATPPRDDARPPSGTAEPGNDTDVI